MSALGRVARLERLVAEAGAMTLGTSAPPTLTPAALIAELAGLPIADAADELEPHLERLEAELRTTLATAAPELADAAVNYQWSTIKWRPDPPAMPVAIVGYIALVHLEALRRSCRYVRAERHYESLRRPDDRCDCAARIAATFYPVVPTATLRLVDSAGVPYAAMDYLWRCDACGARWHQGEGYDDLGAHSVWSPTDATTA